MAACGVVKCGPEYAGGVELVVPVDPVVPGEPVVGDVVGEAGLAGVAGADGLGAAAAVMCRDWAPVALAWCGGPDAQAETRIIKPAAPASGMRWRGADRCDGRRRDVRPSASRRAEQAKRCMAFPFC
jgi:hypothetical protein